MTASGVTSEHGIGLGVDPEPVTELLADGSVVTVRPLRPDDREQLAALHRAASDNSFYLRFFSMSRSAADSFVDHVCGSDELTWSLVALRTGRLVGVATASAVDTGTSAEAEVALLVSDDLHGRGVGTLLLERLASWSRMRGVQRFTAEVLAMNASMMRVFRDLGFAVTEHRDREVVDLVLDILPTPASLAAGDQRWRTAERHSLRRLLEPASVAVLGVSRRRGGIGREVLENVLASGYGGHVVALGRPGLDVDGVECVSSVHEVPEGVDLVVVAVAADEVESAVAAVAARGAGSCVVLSSGLGETSEVGKEVERRLREVAAEHGTRIVGPNCFGVISHLRDTRLDATFGRGRSRPGTLAIGSQSGGVGIALQDAVRRRGDGIACFVSLGNKADVSGNDLLAAWADDPDVAAAGLYLESFHDPARFVQVAGYFAARKPLVVVYGGTSAAGERAGQSHTSASATPRRALEAMFRAAGVIGVNSVTELVDTAALLTGQPLPCGPRLAVLGNAGGLGILAADTAQRAGLDVPDLSSAGRDLRAALAGAASAANPVDLGAAAGPGAFGRALTALRAEPGVDAVLVLVAATAVTDLDGVCAAVEEAAVASPVPVLTVVSGDAAPPPRTTTRFGSADEAVAALARAVGYAAWRSEGGPAVLPPAQPLVAAARPSNAGGWLGPERAAALVCSRGLALPAQRVVSDTDGARAAAQELGLPVVVKVAVAELVHKTESGAVRTGLRTLREVADATEELLAGLPAGSPLLVQAQVAGPEIAVGLTRDPRFGPLLMVSSGGTAIGLWDDQVFLMPPLRRSQVRAALHSLRTWPLLTGYRGSLPVEVEPVVDLVDEVARLAVERPDVAELDLNPVVCTSTGPVCVDVKVRLASTPDER